MNVSGVSQADRGFRWLAVSTVLSTFLLVVVGGLVRTSSSGLGCPDWPLCYGQFFPGGRLYGATTVEFSHRLISAIVALLVLTMMLFVWRRYRKDPWVFRPMVLAVLLLVLQVALGGITVLQELPPAIVAFHFATALFLLGSLVTVTVFAFRPMRALEEGLTTRRDILPRLAIASAVSTFVLIVSGTAVAGLFAGYTCSTWPLCDGQLVPSGTMPLTNVLHRYLAAATGILFLLTWILAWRTRRHDKALVTASIITASLFIFQNAIGAVNVVNSLPLVASVLHLAAATAVWASTVAFTLLILVTPPRVTEAKETSEPRGPAGRGRLVDYFILTKPWIVALLIATTLGGMFVAQRGIPPLSLVFFTFLGGILAAGGASALNSYFDRDIDPLMGRTARRPIPSGRITPRAALVYALALCTAGLLILAVWVNLLSALIALAGIIYYAVIYTLVLKRSTPQNVVIGGAAGALPPLVGWAAVTNEINLLAVYLFLIIFYWTPPHTWALMLMVKKDYERVHVPMMPVARGEPETRRQIVLYSLLMVAITLVPFSLRDAGFVYLVTALVLGSWFLFLAIKLLRDHSKQTARRLYRYSNAYLALLFLAMVIDHSALYILF